MTKSEIFKTAHREAKRNQFNFGTYSQRLSSALKSIYNRLRVQKKSLEASIQRDAVALKLQEVSFKKYTSTKTQPTSCHFGAWSWERKLSA